MAELGWISTRTLSRGVTWALLVTLLCGVQSRLAAQQAPTAPGAPGAATATGPEKKYVELSHSKDRVIKATAERYLNLVKFQEWGGASGKTQMAKYVSHDPDLKRVKLSVARGSGKDRVVKEFDVEVEKLNKTCQARVKQIDILQKRLDELAKTAAAQDNGVGGRGAPEGLVAGPGGAPPGPEATPAGPEAASPQPGAPPQAAPAEDPSASEPDPLGFAELPPATPMPQAGPGAAGPNPLFPGARSAAPQLPKPDRSKWRNDLASFASNPTVTPDPSGNPQIDWGALRELREMHDIVAAQRGPEPPARSPEAETPVAISERLGDMHWQIVVDKVEEAPGGLVIPTFHPVDLPKPLELRFVLDDAEDVQKWAKLVPGSTVNVAARLSISEPYKITAKVKLADGK